MNASAKHLLLLNYTPVNFILSAAFALNEWMNPMSKQISLREAASLIKEGDAISPGGTLLHRTPAALVREIARSGIRRLTLIKPSPGYDADLLCAAGAVERVISGIVTFEAEFGLAPHYRKAIEKGLTGLTEHA